MITNRTKILIVDDDYSTRKLTERFIRKNWRCDVTHAGDGSEALKIMLRNETPNLVILDIVMPFMTGIEVLKTMRASAKLKNISVLACSSLDDNKAVMEILRYGVADYIVKPFDEETLIEKISSIFAKME